MPVVSDINSVKNVNVHVQRITGVDHIYRLA